MGFLRRLFGKGPASPTARSVTRTTSEDAGPARPGLDKVVNEIISLDRQLNGLATEGKGNSDSEWSRCDDRLTAIGRELHAEGGEQRMRAALELAYQKGMRGRYVDRHWTGIGTWMG